MNRFRPLCLAMSLLLATVACSPDRTNVEDVTFTLIYGIDLDKNDQLVFSLSSPVFSKEAKDKEEEYEVRTATSRQSREAFDQGVVALTVGGKIQVLLLGKRVLQHKDWFKLLDPLYRDVKNAVLSTVVMVDGPVSDIVLFKKSDKPRLSSYLKKLIETTNHRNIAVKTSLQELHRQMMDKAVTPSISEIRKEENLIVTGTALLDADGLYRLSIGPNENKLLALLSKHRKGDFPFTIKLESQKKGAVFNLDRISFNTIQSSAKTNVRYEDDRFRFDVRVNMRISLSERLFPFDIRGDAAELQRMIESELESQYEKLFQKIQKAKIDPAGFGLYARSKEYRHWKDVQNHWGEAFAKADVRFKVNVKISAMGAIE